LLTNLSIQNYAIIEQLEINFSKSLNVITGETGAGKSIIMGALGLILGQRADSSALVNKEKKCIIEAYFVLNNKKEIHSFLNANDLDSTDELVIRREITSSGKSRAFINDTPVTLAQLNILSHLLVDMHQQFDTLELTQNDFQRQVLDALAGNGSLLDEYESLYHQWQNIKKRKEVLQNQKLQFEKEADYHRFQFTELQEAAFKPNELEEAETSLTLLSNAEGIKNVLTNVQYQLHESETPIVQQLKSIIHQLNNFATVHTALPEIIQRLQSTQVELKDIADEIAHISDGVQHDPQKIEMLNERLSLGYKLQKKHSVNSTNELLEIQQSLEEKLQAVFNIDDAIALNEKECIQLEDDTKKIAAKLSANRKKQIKPFEEKVNKLLAQVGMPNAKLKISLQPTALNPSGGDDIDFLFNANIPAGKTEHLQLYQPVRKVASGGELSRLMLCIKSLVAESIDLATLIFDEIDTGISGEAAKQVGVILKGLAEKRQIICITHQAQIAGKASAHWFVFKEIKNDKIATGIRLLSTEERITTIAQMLSGEKPTAAALENAREMVRN